MRKRIISGLLAVLLLLALVPFSGFAAEEEPEAERSSSYLNSCMAILYATGTTGKLTLEFDVTATGFMTRVGVYSIVVRNNDGTIHSTVWGSTANGLLKANAWYHAGEYTLNLTSGNTYYCTVIFIARDSTGSDTRKITTSRVVCP